MQVLTMRVKRLLRPACLALAMLALPATSAAQDFDDAPPLPDVAAGEVPEGSVGGMGDINLYPKRVVIDPRQRIASIGLYNRTIDPGEWQQARADGRPFKNPVDARVLRWQS